MFVIPSNNNRHFKHIKWFSDRPKYLYYCLIIISRFGLSIITFNQVFTIKWTNILNSSIVSFYKYLAVNPHFYNIVREIEMLKT